MQKELFPVEESYRTDFEGETRECRTCSIVKGLDMFAPASYGYNKEGKSKKVTVIDKEKSQWLDNKQLFFKA